STPADQVEVFIARLRLFFSVPYAPMVPIVPAPAAAPVFPQAGGDVFARFVANHAGVYTVGGAHNAAAVAAAVQATFPGDVAAQEWLVEALAVLDALHALTAFAPSELQFSLMEALYARGFTSAASVQQLSPVDFLHALEGSVAYPFAAQIQAAAGSSTAVPEGPPGPFGPVNGGDLTDCVPPEHLSPFGPVAYLHDLLQVCPASTCEDPLHGVEKNNGGAPDSIGAQLATRRGPLGDLHATAANLATPLPAIDLVNESLEALAASVAGGGSGAGGAVFDTSASGVAGHSVAAHDAGELFAAIPEHSAPDAAGVSAAGAAAYAALAADASSPLLPYDQPVNTARAYLEAMGGSRYEAMRRFRRDITEFVLDPAPADEPAGFARHLWRYPVRLELALEYLCLLPQEYELLFGAHGGSEDDQLGPWLVYGFRSRFENDIEWTTVVSRVDELLKRLGLTYCELRELQLTGLVPFQVLVRGGDGTVGHGPINRTGPIDRADHDHDPGNSRPDDGGSDNDGGQGRLRLLPECQPCCLDDLRVIFLDGDTVDPRPVVALWRLALVARLFRKLRDRCAGGLSFQMLADVAAVLRLFDENGLPNPDFPRQLAALLMLAEDYCLEFCDRCCELPEDPGPTDRMPILGLWTSGQAFARAVDLLVDAIGDTAQRYERDLRVTPELAKLVADNLDPLSALCGFDPDTASDSWHALPTHTLRFAEVLLKIYRSPFTVGEVLFLFTTAEHLTGDDPFPLQDRGEAVVDPLSFPDSGTDSEPQDDTGPHSLWILRGALRSVELDDGDVKAWTWPRIVAALRTDLGYPPPAGPDPLREVARRFFGDQVHATAAQRRFEVNLPAAATSPDMWAGGPPDGPFQYDPVDGKLWTTLPMRDADVLDRLLNLRPLNHAERIAVRDLYFAPRAALAPLAALFENPVHTIEQLIHTENSKARFGIFRRAFALVHARCALIAEHLAAHVRDATSTDGDAPVRQAWAVLRSLWADENFGLTPWEDDSGAPPDVTWKPKPSGGAFAAILGVVGTGLVGEYGPPASCDEVGTPPSPLLWREIRGPLSAFGEARDERNAPVPTVIPALQFALTPAQQGYVSLRNGMALLDATGAPLGGAQPFAVRWTGVLLVEKGGSYRFHAATHGEDDCACEGRSWRLTLRRGQRWWTVLNKDFAGEPAPDHHSGVLRLHRGAYEITIDVEQREPTFDRREEVCPQTTGFRFAYEGPDTGDEVAVLPFDKLFRATKDSTLWHGVEPLDAAESDGEAPAGQPGAWLDGLYTSTLRDARRTYQRAFKGLLLAHRFRLSAEIVPAYRQSELGYLLAHGEAFAGVTHQRTGPSSFGTHHAWLALDLLPVSDPYPPAAVLAQPVPPYPPVPDQRSDPSRQRSAALFDVWERLYDYFSLRRASREARDRPAWLLFAEVTEHQPDDPVELLRHIGVDLRYAQLVTSYFVPAPGPSPYVLTGDDLADERWATRAWQGNTWLDRLCRHVFPLAIAAATPFAWAADQPDNVNLTSFLQDALIENGEPRRYTDLRELNDCLRLRAREALLAYLTGMSRVALPWGGFATTPRELSDLLLTDVEAGLCLRLSRIEDAVSVVQAFVQRALLGLEPSFVVTPAFASAWQKRFATFREWQACVRREVYRENWIEWDDLRLARRSEAFTMLEQRLAEDTLSIAEPGGLSWWSGPRPPSYGCLTLLQEAQPAALWLVNPPPEGLGLLGSSERAAQPSWLAPVNGPATPPPPQDDDNPDDPGDNPDQPPDDIPIPRVNRPEPAVTADEEPTAGRPRRGHRATSAASKPRRHEVTASAAASGRRRRKADDADAATSTVAAPETASAAAELAVPAAAAAATSGPLAAGDRLPLWLEAAISLGAPFIRVAAAGIPPGSARFAAHSVPGGCCADCGCEHEPLVDEYYFWLGGSKRFVEDDAVQDAEAGVIVSTEQDPADQTSDWHRPEQLPGMLEWPPRGTVHLWWCRVHAGRFQQPRHSTDGVLLAEGQTSPVLELNGRTADSLRFTVPGAPVPVGYTDPASPGFRYDLVTDSAVVLPLVAPPIAGPPTFPGGLDAYPYFAFHTPGAPLLPLSTFAVAMTVAGALRTHCDLEAALAWYDLAYRPSHSDNTWAICDGGRTPGDTVPGTPDLPPGTTVPVPADTPPGTNVPGRPPGSSDPAHPRNPGRDEACCPSSPVDPATARHRAVLLAYLETLLQIADGHLCKGSIEAAQLARVVLDAMARLLGPAPRRITAADAGTPDTVAQFDASPAPLNPRLLALYERLQDRQALVRRCLDGHRLRRGARRDTNAFWADADPRTAWQPDCGCDCGDGCGACCSGPYRFTFVVQKALELAAEVRALGANLLSVYEKGDADALAAIRAGNERQVAELAIRTRQLQWREADWSVQALYKTKQGALARLAYYQRLLRNGLNAGELGYQAATTVSLASRAAANISEAIAQGIGMTPDMWMGVAGIAGTP
ncbi:MAG TPA: neuraminidase-like domain-containing protein, partial [Pseudonocardiaceae bacterium]|nr:neuraminidase-like domain-containing protein [Pseudonocardiaceae bacterium]